MKKFLLFTENGITKQSGEISKKTIPAGMKLILMMMVISLSWVNSMAQSLSAPAGPLTFVSCSGTASAEQSFTVTAVDLDNNENITVESSSADFEISLTSGIDWSSSVNFNADGLGNATVTIYVRSTSTASSGAIAGNIEYYSASGFPFPYQSVLVDGMVYTVEAGSAGQTSVSCFGGSNGTATVSVAGGTGPYAYLWSNSETTITATTLAEGNYTVLVTDANLCTASHTFTITQPLSALVAGSAGQTPVSCFGGSNGSATVSAAGGTPVYGYSWSGGGASATKTGLAAGTHTATVTDANGCTSTQIFTIIEPTQVVAGSAGQTSVSCNGGTNGTATVSATGGTGAYTYLWSNGGTSALKTGLAAATYTATVTDANTCSSQQIFTITQPTALTVSNSTQVNPCSGGNSGSASVTVTGGTPTYSYLWNVGGTSATKSGLAVGSYTVTVTDANLCTTTKTFSLVAATTYTYTGTGAWTVTGNWSPCYPGTTIPDGSNVIISVGSTVTIPTGTIVINNGAILNDGNITVSGGTFTNNGDYGGIGTFTGALFTNPPAGLFAPGD